MVVCQDCATMHTCRICGVTEQCEDEITPGTCDFREHYKAHGYCVGKLPDSEKLLFFADDIFTVEQAECSRCGEGFASNTFCAKCQEVLRK